MERVDVLGPDRERLRVVVGGVLAPDLDEELQSIVEEAARVTRSPISLVSLVLQRVQFFRAFHGLPDDLAVSRATDRDASFCQFVVRDRAPFEVTDARADDRVPQFLVDRYGVRSYLGMPITVDGVVLGSLCVMGLEPRQFDTEDRSRLAALAERASRRLAELTAIASRKTMQLLDLAARPSFQEIRNILQPLQGHASLVGVAAVELECLTRLVGEIASNGSLAPQSVETLRNAAGASRDLAESAEALEISSDRLSSALLALEKAVVERERETHVPDAVSAASELALHLTKLAGGVRWAPIPSHLTARVPRSFAVPALSAILGELAERIRQKKSPSGLEGTVCDGEHGVEVRVGSPELTLASVEESVVRLRALLGPLSAVQVEPDGTGIKALLPK